MHAGPAAPQLTKIVLEKSCKVLCTPARPCLLAISAEPRLRLWHAGPAADLPRGWHCQADSRVAQTGEPSCKREAEPGLFELLTASSDPASAGIPPQLAQAVRRPELRIEDVKPVGSYAVQLEFSDGHKHGIFSFDALHALAQQKWTRMRHHVQALHAAQAEVQAFRSSVSRRRS